jgi:hypothetical protein
LLGFIVTFNALELVALIFFQMFTAISVLGIRILSNREYFGMKKVIALEEYASSYSRSIVYSCFGFLPLFIVYGSFSFSLLKGLIALLVTGSYAASIWLIPKEQFKEIRATVQMPDVKFRERTYYYASPFFAPALAIILGIVFLLFSL